MAVCRTVAAWTLAALAGPLLSGNTAFGQARCYCPPACGPSWGAPGYDYGGKPVPGVAPPAVPKAPAPEEAFAPSPLELAEAAPAQAGEMFAMYTPGFMGDFFGCAMPDSTTFMLQRVGGDNFTTKVPVQEIDLLIPSCGSIVGVQKLVENSSPIPRDRLLFNYSFYNNVRFTENGVDVNRFVAGFEKTFWDGTGSIELRAPFASTLNSNQFLGVPADVTNTEFGNLTLYAKFLLLTGQAYAIGGGLGVAVPTADDLNLRVDDTPIVRIENQAVHLLPYVGGVYAPDDRFFAQAILQIDVDANGNDAFVFGPTGGLERVGKLTDATWLFASLNLGCWTHRAPIDERLSGVAPFFEIHYNGTLNRSDVVTHEIQSGTFRFGRPARQLEMINLVAGVNFEFYGTSYLSVGYIIPTTGGDDQFFDGELRVLFSRYFW